MKTVVCALRSWALARPKKGAMGCFTAQGTLKHEFTKTIMVQCAGRAEERKANVEALENIQVVGGAMTRKQKSYIQFERRIQTT